MELSNCVECMTHTVSAVSIKTSSFSHPGDDFKVQLARITKKFDHASGGVQRNSRHMTLQLVSVILALPAAAVKIWLRMYRREL
jgi:hypothetical protein